MRRRLRQRTPGRRPDPLRLLRGWLRRIRHGPRAVPGVAGAFAERPLRRLWRVHGPVPARRARHRARFAGPGVVRLKSAPIAVAVCMAAAALRAAAAAPLPPWGG